MLEHITLNQLLNQLKTSFTITSSSSSQGWSVDPHLFGVPDLRSICVHDQQLLVALSWGKANFLHPATMCWYTPKIIDSEELKHV